MRVFSYPTTELPVLQTVECFKPREDIHIHSVDDPLPLLARLPEDGLAVVGTRYPQRRSFELLENVIRELRGTELVIVSGFARGIDSRAHDLAIECGLKTIAILGCGIDVDYPRENRILRRKILESGGALLSHFPLGTPAYQSNFLERNQLIAGFAKATWVVEAAEVSGTLNTANWAMKMNRNLYATSCFPGDTFFQGNEKLLGQRDPDRYPIAEPLFGGHSLATSWPFLAEKPELGLPPTEQRTQIQKWVLQLQSEFGSCEVQTLMNHASAQGLTLGGFYLQFEQELESGQITQDPAGRVEIAKCRT